jgi:hypothetical protein
LPGGQGKKERELIGKRLRRGRRAEQPGYVKEAQDQQQLPYQSS